MIVPTCAGIDVRYTIVVGILADDANIKGFEGKQAGAAAIGAGSHVISSTGRAVYRIKISTVVTVTIIVIVNTVTQGVAQRLCQIVSKTGAIRITLCLTPAFVNPKTDGISFRAGLNGSL
jgi:hypothetical protein